MYLICDIDGTLADIKHRLHYIQGKSKNYDLFYDKCTDDTPIRHVVDMVEGYDTFGYEIIFVSGRPDSHREQTENWLYENVLLYQDYNVWMRKAGDHRPDYVIKREIYDQIVEIKGGEKPAFAVDDRPQIVHRCWRPLGIPIVRVGDWFEEEKPQCAPGTLYVLCGPTGAGKTTAIQNHDALKNAFYIGSDDMRVRICGDFKDQTKNDQVFAACHALIGDAVSHGVDVCFDATNIKTKDRKKAVEMVGDAPVVYVVVNRPVEEKKRDGGWRNEIDGLIDRHENTFKSNLKDILKGDGLPNVTVWDLRNE